MPPPHHSLGALDPDALATLAVLGKDASAVGSSVETSLRRALGTSEIVVGSLENATTRAVDGAAWGRVASDEVLAVKGAVEQPELLLKLNEASSVRAAFALRQAHKAPSWHWPLRIGVLPNMNALADAVGAQLSWLNELFEMVVLGRDRADCDIAVAVGRADMEAYSRSVGVEAGLLVQLEPHIDQYGSELTRAIECSEAVDASGAALLRGSPASAVPFFGELVARLSRAEELPVAFQGAARATNHVGVLQATMPLVRASNLRRHAGQIAERAQHARMAAATIGVEPNFAAGIGIDVGTAPLTEFAERLARQADTLEFDSESGPSVAVAAIGRAVERVEPPRRGPRFLQAQLHRRRGSEWRISQTYRGGCDHRVAVRIGQAATDWTSAAAPFPERDLFPPRTKVVELDISLAVPTSGYTTSSKVKLPRFGDSDPVLMPLKLPSSLNRLRAFIQVSLGPRVLQVGELRAGPRSSSFELLNVSADGRLDRLPDPKNSDQVVSLVVGDVDAVVTAGQPGAIVVKAATAQQLVAAGTAVAIALREAADSIQAAHNAGRWTSGVTAGPLKSFRDVAQAGSDFAAVIDAAQLLKLLQGADTVRVLHTQDAPVVPFELVYDGAVSNTATLCATSVDRCHCDNRSKSSVICIRRFWGLSKVVERHAPLPTSGGSRMPATSVRPDRAVLAPLSSVLFGSTAKVAEEIQNEAYEKISTLARDHDRVNSWGQWRRRAHRRSLLVGIVHNEEIVPGSLTALELGHGDLLRLGQLDTKIVGGRPTSGSGPLVMLIGCQTAAPDRPLMSFVSRLRAKGAAIILASAMDLPAEHAGPLTVGLLQAFDVATRATPEGAVLGAVLRQARATLLSEGYVLGLGLIAYGDAHYRLTRFD